MQTRRRGSALALLLLLVLAARAEAAAPTFRVPDRCVAGSCKVSVAYVVAPGETARVEVDWVHRGPAATGFRADRTFRCVPKDSADGVYGGGSPGVSVTCKAQSPAYAVVGATTIVVRVTPNGGKAEYATRALTVRSRRGRTQRPAPAGDALCGPRRAGVQCGPGNGRKTTGGGEKVSHKGWPSVTGILWKVTMAAGRHRKTGGPANDELLGHHGSEVLRGGAGKDILWGDWDPVGNTTRQTDRLHGGPGNDWLYSSHGRNTLSGGPGRDYVWAYYGKGTIDCGPGFDTLRLRLGAPYRHRNCERIKNFCSFGSKPGDEGGCYKPGERPRR